MADLAAQLDEQRRTVSYDVFDLSVRQIVDMVENNLIKTDPDYQRHFVWDAERESALIESIFLGIPVPSMYMATNSDGTWEVVDGVQRISSLIHFVGSKKLLPIIGRPESLVLSGMEKLDAFNSHSFISLPMSLQLGFTLRSLRVTTLNDKSDLNVRYDLFERLNTGGIKLHQQEIRNCVFRGALRAQLKELAGEKDFLHAVRLPNNEEAKANYEECVLRFFAFLQRYQSFEHSVKDFLDDFMKDYSAIGVTDKDVRLFRSTMAELRKALPSGIVRGTRTKTPVNLYEAVSVGVALALKARRPVNARKLHRIMDSAELREVTTGATNSRRMVVERIERVRDAI